ncbi:MAG: hypothetical protein KIS96_05120 [Bauldia sp.]|nr:hypothetical protein [Bauldia sp.]
MLRRLVVTASLLMLGIGAAQAQDWTLNPEAGSIKLATGFTPDPYTVDLFGGGPIDASWLGGDCFGYITEEPDLRVFYTAGSMPLSFSVTSSRDTLLLVSDPQGNWFCNDDSGGSLDPRVTLESPLSGQYDIWVGTFGDENIPATLWLSEFPPESSLNWNLDPEFGVATLVAGFTPDPQQYSVNAGGSVYAYGALGDYCYGYVTAAPTYRLFYTAGSFPLFIFAEAANDLTLVVNTPSGEWLCDDDSGVGLDPLISIDAPLSGQYDIWVGTFSSDRASATLSISEIGGPEDEDFSAVGLNWDLPPNFGTVDLEAGFLPDPHVIEVAPGGSIDINADLGGNCYGYASAAADYRLFYIAGGFPLTFAVDSGTDTTLVVADPEGTFHCDDDSGPGLNPTITFDPPLDGQYDVWIGTYSSSGGGSATLSITELGPPSDDFFDPPPDIIPSIPPVIPDDVELPDFVEDEPVAPPVSDGAGLDWTLDPAFGALDLSSGFAPDPQTVFVDAGGPLSAGAALGAANPSCIGNVTAAPTARINYAAQSWPLIISVASESDTTLVVSDPDGNWICDDDSGGGLNPSVRFDTPVAGQYDVWVGSFTDAPTAATLFISEMTSQ